MAISTLKMQIFLRLGQLLIFQYLFYLRVKGESVVVVESLTIKECDNHIDIPLILGEDLFLKAKISTQSVQSLMVSMWVYPLEIDIIERSLFSVYSSSLMTRIASFWYQQPDQKLFGELKGGSIFVQYVQKQVWNFIRLLVELSPSPGAGNDRIKVQLINESQFLAENSNVWPSISGSISSLDRSNLLFVFGDSNSKILDEPSCAKIQNMVIELNFSSIEWTNPQMFKSSSLFRTNIVAHYDLFYSQNNPQTLMSFHKYQSRIPNVELTNGIPVAIKPSKNIRLGSYSLSEKKGVILYFEMKALQPTESNTILNALLRGNESFVLLQSISNEIYYSQNGNPKVLVLNSVPGEWIQFVVKITQSLISSVTSISLSYGTAISAITMTYTNRHGDVLFEFGDILSSSSLVIDNIRIYKGTYTKETSACLMQVDGDTQECLLCKSTYLLSYESGVTCVSTGSSIEKQNIVDWNRADCPLNMMHLNFSSTCACPFQFYRSADSCFACPTFCKGCISATKCIEKDNLRNEINGLCPSKMFDDKFNCIKPTFQIQKQAFFQSNDTFSRTSSDLNLSKYNSFFLTFDIEFRTTNQTPTKFGRIKDSGATIFEITVEINRKICLIYKGNIKLVCLPQFENSSSQLGLWVGISKVIFALATNDTFRYKEINLPSPLSLLNLIFCFGLCESAFDTYISGTVTNYLSQWLNYLIFPGMSSPIDKIDDLYFIMSGVFYFFGQLLIKPVTQNYPVYIQDNHQIGFKITKLSPINRLKGLQTTGMGIFLMQTPKFLEFVSLNIFIEKLNYEYRFATLNQDMYFSLIPTYNQNDQYQIKINYKDQSLYSKKCFISQNKPNFLAFIITKTGSNYFSWFYFYFTEENLAFWRYFSVKIELICNFSRETLELQSFNFIENESPLVFLESSMESIVFINNINYSSKSFLYFDYSEEDPCFIYRQLTNKFCLKAKEGFVIHKGIPKDDCSNITDGLTKWFYNQYTGECEQSDIKYACQTIDPEEGTCLACQDPNADPSSECTCYQGFYFESQISKCAKCLDKCSSCNSGNTCLTCKGKGTNIPDCDCLVSPSFQFSNYDCEACESQCNSCDTRSDFCLDCSINRISPPICSCDSQFFDNTISTTSQCIPYQCSYQCETCEYSVSNCTECSLNRNNTPKCDCQENYFEINQVCEKCNSHYYYNESSQKCLPCHYSCAECSHSAFECTECDPVLYLHQSRCVCSDLSLFTRTQTGEFQCASGMDVKVSVQNQNGQMQLIFTFEYDIDPLDLSYESIDKLIFLYFNQIPNSGFKIESVSNSHNQLILHLNFFQSFDSQEGYVNFLNVIPFTNSKKQMILDQKYLRTILKFKVGQFIVQNGVFSISEIEDSAFTLLQEDQNEGVSLLSVFKQLQIAYYVINTLQPSSLFIMVNILLPPNLYKVLQIAGSLIFSNIGEQTTTQNQKQNLSFFGDPIELGNDVSVNSQLFFQRFGITGSLFITMPIMFLQLLFWFLSQIVVKLIIKAIIKDQINDTSKLLSVNSFLQKRMFACIEGGSLALVILSINQFQNIHAEQFFNRMSVYIACITILAILTLYFRICFIHKEQMRRKTQEQVELTQKLKRNNKGVSLLYLNFQIGKKLSMSFFIVFAVEFPFLICSINSFLLFVSIGLTGFIQPYQSRIRNLIKIVGEICQLFTWMIYIFVFIPFEKQVHELTAISSEDTETFIYYGECCIYALIVFNGVYLFEFFMSIGELIKNRKDNSPDKKLPPVQAVQEDRYKTQFKPDKKLPPVQAVKEDRYKTQFKEIKTTQYQRYKGNQQSNFTINRPTLL